jgi:hypothetical protein
MHLCVHPPLFNIVALHCACTMRTLHLQPANCCAAGMSIYISGGFGYCCCFGGVNGADNKLSTITGLAYFHFIKHMLLLHLREVQTDVNLWGWYCLC